MINNWIIIQSFTTFFAFPTTQYRLPAGKTQDKTEFPLTFCSPKHFEPLMIIQFGCVPYGGPQWSTGNKYSSLIKGRRTHAQFGRFVGIWRGIQIQLCTYYKFWEKKRCNINNRAHCKVFKLTFLCSGGTPTSLPNEIGNHLNTILYSEPSALICQYIIW